ncbi:MAG: hypothetical protein ACFFDN_24930 [Candidatus Hodarchaeota archaeon]
MCEKNEKKGFWRWWKINKKWSVFLNGIIITFTVFVYTMVLILLLFFFVFLFNGSMPSEGVAFIAVVISIGLACIPTVFIHQYIDYYLFYREKIEVEIKT